MKNMDERPERQALIDQMMEIARHDAPWVWGFYPKALQPAPRLAEQRQPNLMANNTLKYQRIDPRAAGAAARRVEPARALAALAGLGAGPGPGAVPAGCGLRAAARAEHGHL